MCHKETIEPVYHRVDRVLGFFSSRPNWDFTPSPAGECATTPPPLLWFRREYTLACGRGSEGGPNSDEGTDTVVL